MKLCIAEKPSVAADIAKVIGANVRNSGFFSGNDYCVTWVFGHLCELKEPHDYNPLLKRWDFHDLPIIPDKFGIKLKDDSGVKRQFDVIRSLVAKADCVINCGDAGQEGELIQRWVMQLAGVSCPVLRLWISSLTEEAIRDGFASLRDSKEFDSVYAAGSARAIGDWLLGMNATRAYSIRYGGRGILLSIGRVQTPTLALIVSRYLEIKNFKPEKYWELKTRYRDVLFSAEEGKFKTVEEGQQIIKTIKNQPFQIDDITSKKGKEAPPQLFDLTTLQVECNNKFSFSAEDTLRIVQSLYENKYTTYPRVDTRFLPDDIYPKVPIILRGLTPYANLVGPLIQQSILPKSNRVFNNVKVTDHHAIIPTGTPPAPSMSRDEKLVYDLIARRFIAVFYPDCQVLLTTILGSSAKVKFKVSGKQIVEPGWRVVIGNASSTSDAKADADETLSILPDFKVGEMGAHEPILAQKQTSPPKLYTEATLLRAMETAGKQVDNEELRSLMKQNGIGRPSTRAAIIETLFKRRYISKERKNLVPTLTGLRLIDTIKTPLLKSVEMTGLWERRLRQIESGEYTTDQFIAEMRTMVSEVIQNVISDTQTPRFESLPDVAADARPSTKTPSSKQTAKSQQMICPSCGKPILKGNKAWGCSGFKDGCRVVVPFIAYGKKLTENQVAALFAKGETTLMKGLDVDGSKQDGKLAFDSSFGLIVKPVESRRPDVSSLTCPRCGGQILEGRNAWGCSGYKSGCRFLVPYVFLGKKLTLTHLSVLIKKGKTGVISGFTDNLGVSRRGSLVFDDNGQLLLSESK